MAPDGGPAVIQLLHHLEVEGYLIMFRGRCLVVDASRVQRSNFLGQGLLLPVVEIGTSNHQEPGGD